MPSTAFQDTSAPLFVPNEGQTDEKARFFARLNGQQFYFTQSGIVAVSYARPEDGGTVDKRVSMRDSLHKREPVSDTPTRGAALFLIFEGAAQVEPQGQKQAQGRFHYFMGNDPANWRTMLPSFAQLQYANLWEGVDLTLAGSEGGLKFLWTLNNPSRIGQIRIRYEGAEEISLTEDGSLLVRHALGKLTDTAPVAWQEIGGVKKPVACAYALKGSTVSFAISGAYDANAPLFIDPMLPYSTYLGGSENDNGYGIAADAQGCAYVGGATTSLDFPSTPGAFQQTFSGTGDAFVSKFTPDGSALIYSTFLGGSGGNGCSGLTIDALGCVYIVGYTTSADYPTTPGAFQTVFGGVYDVIVTKLAANGASLVYSTFLGGSSFDTGRGIAVDEQGHAYVCGFTASPNFPVTPGAFQTTLVKSIDAFVTKLSPNGTSLAYSTYFSGSDSQNEATAIAVDRFGCAYITGFWGAGLPVTPGAFQTAFGGGYYDAYATKFAADGASLVYSTYLGGSGGDIGRDIVVDEAGCAIVAGGTDSANFPTTPGTFEPVFSGGIFDSFIAKVSPDGSSLIASTFLGGTGYDQALSVALDSQGNVYLTGEINSYNFPITPQVVPSSLSGYTSSFVSILSPGLNRLLVSYYLGGSQYNTGWSITVGPNGDVYTTGDTSSLDFPVSPGAFQSALSGSLDALVTKSGFALLKKASITLQGLS